LQARRWRLGVGLSAFLTTALIVGTVAVAGATVEDSNSFNYGPVDGVSYGNQSAISNTPLYGFAGAWTSNNQDVPAGYIGVAANLYESNGVKCEGTTYSFNPSSSSGWSNATSGNCGATYYYGSGNTSAYNGDGYNNYATYLSPDLYWS